MVSTGIVGNSLSNAFVSILVFLQSLNEWIDIRSCVELYFTTLFQIVVNLSYSLFDRFDCSFVY